MSRFLIFLMSMLMLTGVIAEPVEQKSAHVKPEMSHHRGERAITISLDDSANAVLWKPDLSTVPLSIAEGKITLPKTGVDNYHAIVAEQQQGNSKEAVIRYVYRHGKPSGHSTSELTAFNKTELEIVPDPVPREHNRYYSQETWDFIVRFQGKPLPNQHVILRTDNGSIIQKISDNFGKVSFVLPNDFDNVIVGERDRRKAKMSVMTELKQNEQKWYTRLDADYAVSPTYWRVTFLGVIVMVIGMIIGTLLILNNKEKVEQG